MKKPRNMHICDFCNKIILEETKIQIWEIRINSGCGQRQVIKELCLYCYNKFKKKLQDKQEVKE